MKSEFGSCPVSSELALLTFAGKRMGEIALIAYLNLLLCKYFSEK